MIEDTSFVLRHKIYKTLYQKVSDNEIGIFLNSHPTGGSLKAIKDFFNCNGIKCKGYKLPQVHLKELKTPFIAHLINPEEFVVVIDNKKDNLSFQSGRNKTNGGYQDFIKRWKGNVLLVDRENRTNASDYVKKVLTRSKNYFISGAFLILMLFLIFSFIPFNLADWRGVLFNLLLIPLFASTELLNIEGDRLGIISRYVCNFSKLTNCEATLLNPISRIFKISLAQIGFLFFMMLCLVGILLVFAGNPFFIVYKNIAILCLLTSPLSIFFLGYQIVKLRQICPFCFIVQFFNLIIGFSVFLLPPFFRLEWFYLNVEIFITAFLLSLVFVVLYVSALEKEFVLKNKIFEHLQIKRNPLVFNSLAIHQKCNLSIDQNLILNSREGEPKIIFVLDLTCKTCISAIKEYIYIYNNIERVGLSILLMLRKEHEEALKGFINKLYYEYNKKTDWLSLLEKWYADKQFMRSNLFLASKRNYSKKILDFTEKNNLMRSPVLLFNNKIIPSSFSYYDLSDILRIMYT